MEESSRLYTKEIRVVELVEARPVRPVVELVEARPSRSALVLSGTSMPRLVT
jgi:hypothetical protein